jgi:ACT domain-containing protein/GNAT superfamily N-acetyltransferase
MARHELWVELADRPGNLAAVAADLAACGANIVHLDVHAGGDATVIDRLVVQVPDERSHELAEAAARCGATLLQIDEVSPHTLVDDTVRALDVAVALMAADRPDAVAEAIHRIIRADEVRVEAVATAAPAGSPIADALARGVTKIERAWDAGRADDGDGADGNGYGDGDRDGTWDRGPDSRPDESEMPWLLLVPHEHDGVQSIAVVSRVGLRFTATEAARARALMRLAAHVGAGRRSAADAGRPALPATTRRSPTALERLVALSDGGLVRLRHLGSEDRDALVEHHGRCSGRTRRLSRIFAAEAPLAAGIVDGLLRNDGRDHVALAALVGCDIVGVARYDLDPGGPDAEVVVAVEDRHQLRGIGTLLVNELAVLASSGDVRRLRLVTHARDDGMERTVRRAGLGFSTRREGDLTVLECGLPIGVAAGA